MERANHVNIAMIEDIGTNGTARSKVTAAVDQNKKPCGSTVSFHNIQYKVQLKSGFLCKRKTSPREILVDLKSVVKLVHLLFCVSLALCLCELYPSLQLLLFSHYYYSLKYTQRSIVLLVSCCFVIYSQRSGENPIHSCCFKISAYLFRLNQTHSKLRQINLQAFSENKTKNITNEAVFGSLALGNTLRNLLFWVQ